MKTLVIFLVTFIPRFFRHPVSYMKWLSSPESEQVYWGVVSNVTERFQRLRYRPIYYSYFSRDCDMCEVSYVREFLGGRKNYEKMKEKSYEWAEGPTYFTEISREEYEMEKGEYHMRDRVMENYENGGNGYLV